MSLSLPTRVVPKDDILFQDLVSESIMLDLQSEHYFTLDDVGTRMWQLLNEHRETETVVARLLDEYDVDEASLRRDLGALIQKLADAGLVTVED